MKWAEIRYRDSFGDEQTLCHRANAKDCWKMIDSYQGSKYWPHDYYVVNVTETLARRDK